MVAQPGQPRQLVLVVVVGQGPAVGHVGAGHPHPAAGGPQQPGVGVGGVVVVEAVHHLGDPHPAQDGHAVPLAEAVVGALVAQGLEGQGREGVVGQLGLLHAEDVGLDLGDPLLDTVQPGLQRVDVPGGDAHRVTLPGPAGSPGGWPVGWILVAEDPTSTSSSVGPNAWLVDEMYEQYLADPASVSESWHEFFADYRPESSTTTARPRHPAGRRLGHPARRPRRPHARRAGAPTTRPAAPPAATAAAAAGGRRAGRRSPAGCGRPHRHQHGGQPGGAHRHQLPRGPGQAARGQPDHHQRLPGPHPRRQGQLHPPHRLRGGARHRRHHAGHELELRGRRRRQAPGDPPRPHRPGPGRRRRAHQRSHPAGAVHPRCRHPRLPRSSGAPTRT